MSPPPATLVSEPSLVSAAAVAFFSVFGSYAVNGSLFDVWVMFGSAALAMLLATVGVPILPVVLAFILGGVLEKNLGIAVARMRLGTYGLE